LLQVAEVMAGVTLMDHLQQEILAEEAEEEEEMTHIQEVLVALELSLFVIHKSIQHPL
jgi:hypothetical protein